MIISVWRYLFARRAFYKINKILYRLSLSGLGILNYESTKVSGENLFLRNYFKRLQGGVVFDVGANVGRYSRFVLMVNPGATVYAFEPHPKTFVKLVANVDSENFHALNVAVGEEKGVLSLYDYAENDGSSHASLYKDVIEAIHKSQAIEYKVNVISINDFLVSNGIEKIDLLKIDTEGNELNVLKGLANQLRDGMVSAIHFEFNEMNVSSRTYFRDFWNLLPNYDFYRLLPDGMVKIDTYSPAFCEIFAYQNIVAVLKHGWVK